MTIHRLTRMFAVGAIGCTAIGLLAYAAGARINTTKSIRVGLYWVVDQPISKGQYVMFCPPDIGVFREAKRRGYIGPGICDGGYGYLMKKVLAAKMDFIKIADAGVFVNGELLPYSKPLNADSTGRELPRYQADQYTLTEHQLLLMSDVSATSFDGRYFGPINTKQVQTVIKPILTW